MSLLNEALEYAKLGLSIIPVDQKKIPLIKWLPYQEKQASEDEIKEWWGKYPSANIGIITGKISGITVLDCDSKEAITQFRTIYKGMTACSKTPRGAHYYFKHEEGTRNTVKVGNLDMDIRGEGGYVVAPPSVNEKGLPYVWKRKLVDLSALDSLKDSLSLYAQVTDLNNQRVSDSQLSQQESVLFIEGRRDEDLFHVANSLVRGRCKYTRQVLEILAKNCEPPYPEKEIDSKIRSAIDRSARKDKNLAEDYRMWIESAKGQFRVSDYYLESAIVSKEDKHAIIVESAKLVKQGILQNVGVRRGEYRVVDNDMEFMDYVNVNKEGIIDLELPLDIHKKTLIFPKAVIVIAGVTGFGKTTWCLNIVRANMHKYKFYYFNAEMSPLALNKKLGYFMHPIDQWNMDVIPDHKWDYTNIADKIFPNDINIIDYLEPDGDRPYGIHGVVTAIIKKLDKGIAIIATQKRPDVDLSTGGVYSAKAASLYLSLDWCRIKIFKNRYREEDPHPLYNLKDFEVIPTGQHIRENGGWYNETKKKDDEKKKMYASFPSRQPGDDDFPKEA
jgi:hypothetical protein